MFSDEEFFHYSLLTLFFITLPTFISLQFLTAPYGRHRRPGWGPTISSPLAWFIMESPTVWLTLLIFPHGKNNHNTRARAVISFFLIHYIHRTIIYPIKLLIKNPSRKKSSKIETNQTNSNKIEVDPRRKSSQIAGGYPVSVAAMAFCFNLLNAYLQSRWISDYADFDADRWFWWRWCGGAVVFGSGMAANIWSDNLLTGLKSGAGGGYKIPVGGLFDWVSCPNYFGEILEWLGWALMGFSWAGFGFFLYTCANLVPRGGAHHKWYLEKFGEEYPKKRKAVIPLVY